MGFVLIQALILSGIAAALAALLVVADRYVSDYGQCRIVINEDRSLDVRGGGQLLESLAGAKVFIPSACGGRGTCGYCKVKVLDGGGPITPTEEPYLTEADRKAGVRLSCQVKVRRDLRIEIPRHLLSVREFQCVCERIRGLTRDIREFRLRLVEPADISFVPGQYVQLLTPAYNGNEEVYRAYSVSSDPAERGVIELVIRLVPGGICTTYCFERLRANDAVRVNGPYGEFRLSDRDAPILFIAGGSGMAPIKCLLHQMRTTRDPRPATFFFGANTAADLFYRDEMARFERDIPNFRFVPVVARPTEAEAWAGERGLVTEALARHAADISGCEAYLCGSPGMIDAAIKVLAGRGVTEDRIFYDKFA